MRRRFEMRPGDELVVTEEPGDTLRLQSGAPPPTHSSVSPGSSSTPPSTTSATTESAAPRPTPHGDGVGEGHGGASVIRGYCAAPLVHSRTPVLRPSPCPTASPTARSSSVPVGGVGAPHPGRPGTANHPPVGHGPAIPVGHGQLSTRPYVVRLFMNRALQRTRPPPFLSPIDPCSATGVG